MADTSSTKSPTYYISYGFFGGPIHARRFMKGLMDRGYQAAAEGTADIIVAHSAGCWLIEPDAPAKLVVYIGMPLTMARARSAWLAANVNSFRHNPVRNILGRAKNTFYAIAQPRRNWDILKNPRIGKPTVLPAAQALFIVNRQDPWPTGSRLQELIQAKDWTFVSFPGGHDDLWEDSTKYVELIDSYAKRLLA